MKKKYRNRPEKWPVDECQKMIDSMNTAPGQLRFRNHQDAMKFQETQDRRLCIDPHKEPDAYRDATYAQHFLTHPLAFAVQTKP